jgi:hypothetical protein
LLSPKASWRAYILPRGGHASAASTGTLITFDSAAVASRFAANNWVQAGLLTANIRQVSAVGGNSLSVSGAALTVAENDRIYIIGNTQPTVTGGSATYVIPNTVIRQRDDSAATIFTNSMMTSDANGTVQFWAGVNLYDCIIQDSNQANQGSIIDLPVGVVEGVSISTDALFGASLTVNGALGVTGWATFGSSVTMNGALGVTGTATFGSTVTMHANMGVTGTATMSGPLIAGVTFTPIGGFSGTAIIPRLGQLSTPTGGGAIRIVEGNVFPMTVAGVQAALNEVKAAGGGTVYVPNNAQIGITNVSVKIPNRCRLVGTGSPFGSSSTFTMSASTDVASCIENETQDGTQQYAALEHIGILGHASAGCTQAVLFKQLFNGTYINDCLVTGAPRHGVVVSGGAVAQGPMLLWNNTFTNSIRNNLRIVGPGSNIRVDTLTANILTGNSQASIYVGNSAGSASFAHQFTNIYVEAASTYSTGLHLDGVANCRVDGFIVAGTTAQSAIRITGTTSGADGVFAASGHVLTSIQSNNDIVIDDQVAGVTIGVAHGSRLVPFYMSPVAQTDIDDVLVCGIQPARKGVAIVSGNTISPADGSFYEVTGTSQVHSITANPRFSGRVITLMFSNAAPGGVSSGNNIRLAGGVSFSATQWSCLSLVCSGTTWFEASPR